MSEERPRIADQIVDGLRRRAAPRSSADIALEYLGMGPLDESAADLIIRPLLAPDSRVGERAGGWIAVDASAFTGGADEIPLDAPFAAVFAPRTVPEAAAHAAGGPARPEPPSDADELYTVSLGGESEVRRYESRTGVSAPRPVVDVSLTVRRLFGYRGRPDVERIAGWVGASHVVSDSAAGRAQALFEAWEKVASDCIEGGVASCGALALLLEARLGAAEFGGKEFGPADLDALSLGPGCYVFHDLQGAPLYVGRSSRLALRVKSYFVGPPRDAKDERIRSDAHRLEIRETTCTPDAMALEARLIEKLEPRLNRRREWAGTRPGDDAIIVAPVVGRDGAAERERIAFTIRDGELVARTRLAPGSRRAESSARRAVSPLFERKPASAMSAAERRRGALAAGSWSAMHAEALRLEPAIDGDAEMLVRRLIASLRVGG